ALPVLGGALIQLTSVLDGSDGEIARLKKLQSSFGNFFDAVLDRYSDSLIVFGMFYYALNSSRIEGLLGLDPTSLIVGVSAVALASSMLVSYTSAKSRVDFGYTYGGRLTAAGRGRDLRLFVLTIGGIGALVHPVSVLIALSVVAVLTTGILLWRLRISWRYSQRSNPLLGMRLKAVIFDFDGTIVDTMPFLTRIAVGLITSNYGISEEEALARYRATTGLDFESQMEQMFPRHPKNPEVVAAMEASKDQGIFDHALFDEVIPALKFFEASSVRRFICSSTRGEIVRDYIMRARIDGLLDGFLGYRKGFTKGCQIESILDRYGLDPSEVLFVGDSLTDAQFAVDSGLRFIGVSRLFSREEFRERGIFSVGDLSDLARLWDSSRGLIQFAEVAGASVRA
ncbi:MAG: HAD hydrolase-like protein, partial [Vicinamibacteria bacterium]